MQRSGYGPTITNDPIWFLGGHYSTTEIGRCALSSTFEHLLKMGELPSEV
jgi:hypothetical protein